MYTLVKSQESPPNFFSRLTITRPWIEKTLPGGEGGLGIEKKLKFT